MFFNIYIIILSFSVIALIWRRKDNQPFFKYLLLLLILTPIIEISKQHTVGDTHEYLNNSYLLFETVLLSLAYKSVIDKKSIKKIINWLIAFSITLFGISTYSLDVLQVYLVFMSFSHTTIIILGIIYLFEIYSPPFSNDKLFRIPFFWINTANLFFYAGTFLQLGLNSYIIDITEKQSEHLQYINYALNYLIYILYTFGFLCKKIFK